jgi:hypothetical protein
MLGTEALVLDGLTADPVSPDSGEFWFNAVDKALRYFDGVTVVTMAGGAFDENKIGVQRSTCLVMVQGSTGNVGRVN